MQFMTELSDLIQYNEHKDFAVGSVKVDYIEKLELP